jgi:hypothetical protein
MKNWKLVQFVVDEDVWKQFSERVNSSETLPLDGVDWFDFPALREAIEDAAAINVAAPDRSEQP